MAFWLELYNFDKRINSTARPVGAGLAQVECNLLGDTSMLSPAFVLEFADGFSPAIYNYAYIREFKEQGTSTQPGRFYYINDWEYNSPFWIAHMDNDALASWRDEIGDSVEYIARAAQVFDGNITDMVYPATTWITQRKNDIAFTGWTSGGYSCVIGIINDKPNVGAISYYRMSTGELGRLLSYLMSDKIFDGLPEFTRQVITDPNGAITELKDYLNKEVFKYQFNPLQYIASCRLYPFTVAAESTELLRLGYWQTDVVAAQISNTVNSFSKNVAVPKHPQSVDRGNYLNAAPYSRYKLIGGSLGAIPLDSLSLMKTDSLDIDLFVDVATGDARMAAGIPSNTTNFLVGELNGKVGVDVPLAQIAVDHLGGVATAVSSVGEVINRGLHADVGGMIAGAATGIASTVNAWLPQLATQGSAGNLATVRLPFALQSEHLQIVDEDKENKGRPYCKIRKIRDVGGFMVCPDPDIHFPATRTEMEQIRDYMRGGFYWQ